MKGITILIPAYNEEEVLDQLMERVKSMASEINKYEFEFLFVNDGSRVNTLSFLKNNRLKNPKASYVDLSRNFGKETAMLAGLDYDKGDAVIIIEAGLQDPPELIPEMIQYWEEAATFPVHVLFLGTEITKGKH